MNHDEFDDGLGSRIAMSSGGAARSLLCVTVLLAIALVASACAPAGTEPTPTLQPAVLEGTQWTLVSFGPAGAEALPLAGTSITLQFQPGGDAGGSGGCDEYEVPYQVQGNKLTFGTIEYVLTPCSPDSINQQEQAYFSALQTASEFEYDGNTLTIKYNNGQDDLIFTATPPA